MKKPDDEPVARAESHARAKSSTLKTLDAVLEEVASGFPTGKLAYKLLRTLGQHGVALFSSNAKDAATAFAEQVDRDEAIARKLDQVVADAATFGPQLTLVMRTFQDAGRHPHKTLREAQGRFAARVLVSDLDEITRFEVAELLNRMTALDYDYLMLRREYEATGQVYWTDGPGLIAMKGTAKPGKASSGVMLARLRQGSYAGLPVDRLVQVDRRLLNDALLVDIGPEPNVDETDVPGAGTIPRMWRRLTSLGNSVLVLSAP